MRFIITLFLIFQIINTGGVRIIQAQDNPSNFDRIQQLELDSLYAGFWVYYSQGYADRALSIGSRIAASDSLFNDSLDVKVDLRIALLDSADYRKAFPIGYPYGLPFVGGGVAIMPADLSSGAVIDMYAPFGNTASEEVLTQLHAIGLSFEEAAQVMVDLTGLHEIGHVQVSAYGIKARQPWFNEFLATYFGYAYLRSREPELAVVWDAVPQARREGYEPTHTSLDDLNRLYADVGVGDYVWYQDIFTDRVRALYDMQGIEFLRKVREELDDPNWKPESADELLEALEELAPGFVEWADRYEKP